MGARIGGKGAGGSQMPVVAGAEGSGLSADINMTPMIDIMLVLLIIFMIITPSLGAAALVLPKSATAAPEKDDRVTLSIDKDGKYFVDEGNAPVPAAQLTQALQAAYAARPDDHILYLKADNGIEYSLVLTAIDAARQAGVARIGAITEQAKAADSKQGGH